MAAFRLLVDVNVWIAALLGRRLGRTGTASQQIVDLATGLEIAGRPLQLVASHGLLGTLGGHLLQLGFSASLVEPYIDGIAAICSNGPDGLNPLLILGGAEQLAMSDREDAGLLATAIAARADLVVTDNLQDFSTSDSLSVPTSRLRRSGQAERQLHVIIHALPGKPSVMVAHPNDALLWLRRGLKMTPEGICAFYSDDTQKTDS